MRKVIAPLLLLSCVFLYAQDEHGSTWKSVIDSVQVRNPQIVDGNRLDWKEVDATLRALDAMHTRAYNEARAVALQKEQGGTDELPPDARELLDFKMLYKDLFPTVSEEILLPATQAVISVAPESTFAGLNLLGKKGEFKARVLGKFLVWNSGGLYSSSYYTPMLQTDSPRPINTWSADALTFKWADIKNKIAFEYSERSQRERRRMELNALRR